MSDEWNQPDDPRIQNFPVGEGALTLIRWRISKTNELPDRPWAFEAEWNVDGDPFPSVAYWISDELLSDRGVWLSMMEIIKPGSTENCGGFVPFPTPQQPD